MSVAASNWARALLAAVFLLAAVAKVHAIVTGVPAAPSLPRGLFGPGVIAALLAVDFAVVALLISHWWRLGAGVAVVVVIAGNVIYAAMLVGAAHVKAAWCLCAGKAALNPASHAALSVVVCTLAACAWCGRSAVGVARGDAVKESR
jgi:hypothetical protein